MGSQLPPENEDKGEVSASDDGAPLDKFNSLAKGLFGVEREALKEAEQRFRDRTRKAKPTG
jgi:hypothetical protein